jgi:membrane protein
MFHLGGLSLNTLFVRTCKQFLDHRNFTHAAAISYYAMLASVPLLALFLAISVNFLPDLSQTYAGMSDIVNPASVQLEKALRGIMPGHVYQMMEKQILRLQANPPVNFLSLGIVVLLWTASSLFMAVINAMDQIYGVKEPRPYWKNRLIAIFLTVMLLLILVSDLVFILSWPQIIQMMGLTDFAEYFATFIHWAVVYLILLVTFALIFRVGPKSRQRRVWFTPGAVFGTAVLVAANRLFRSYVQNFSHYDQIYGSLGSVVVLLIWFWVASVVLLLAVEINNVIENAQTE